MLISVIGLLALVPAALAGAAQATYCAEDNLLRAFQHTSASACTYCATTSGYPNFLAVQTYPPTRLASACSCFYRFPTEAPSCLTNVYAYTNADVIYGTQIRAQIYIDRTQPCGGTGFTITNVCGYFAGWPIVFDPTLKDATVDYCYFPDQAIPVDSLGVNWGGHYGTVRLYQDSGVIKIQAGQYSPAEYGGAPTPLSCNSCLPCPAP